MLSVGLASADGCKRTQSTDTSPGSTGGETVDAPDRPKRARRKPGLPRPLRLPATAPIVVHVGAPGDELAGLQAHVPDLPPPRRLLGQLVAQVSGAGPLELALPDVVDLERPWDAASVEGELIVHVPIEARHVEAVAQLLADKPPAGRFGAVDLQRTAGPGPKLAWLDREAATLTLADTERGLATGRHLGHEYGKDHALRLDLLAAEARKYAPQFALEQLELRGEGAHRFELRAKGVPPEVLAQLDSLEAGALTGLLESPQIAAGASSKYAHYDRDVRKILGDIKRQVDRQNFLVKGTLEDLLRRLGSVMRSWNGRTMVGVGPKNHVLVAFGADDPKKMGGALAHLLTGVIDNLSLARTLGLSVPKIRFHRSIASGAGNNISVIALEGARKYLPPEAAPLVDAKGDLRVAVAFPARAGAGLMVIGANSQQVLAQWLEDTAEATPASESIEDFIAATAAVSAEDLQALLTSGGDPIALLGLSASREPTRLTLTRKDDVLTARVDGPKPAPRPRNLGNRRVLPRTQPQAQPARTPPPQSKPIR
ncbi:MAG: hypothetical protein KDK70_06210 [Myxococcales bacterium]|nr:hypothetical protein [Myxococcales bacterium]